MDSIIDQVLKMDSSEEENSWQNVPYVKSKSGIGKMRKKLNLES